jgi:hypothetical protein
MTMTARFDDWEGQYLAHFRTKGSKNGVRRYQTESGEWTPLGLRERAKREGWGSEERKARRAENRAARAEKRAAASAARKERMAAYKEERRKNDPKTMTDAELRSRIERVKLEMEYKELTKSPVLKAGEKLVTGFLNYKAKQEERQQAREKHEMDIARLRADVKKTKELTKQKEFDSKKAASDASNSKAQAEKAKITRKRDILNSKIAYKSTTVRGGIAKMLNKSLTGLGEAAATLHKGKAEVKNGKRFVDDLFKTRKRVDKYNKKLDPWQQQMSHDPDEWNRKKNK